MLLGEIGIVRNRATMPSARSMATEMAVPWAADARGHQDDRRGDVGEVAGPPDRAGGTAAGQSGAERAAEHVDEQQQEKQRKADEA